MLLLCASLLSTLYQHKSYSTSKTPPKLHLTQSSLSDSEPTMHSCCHSWYLVPLPFLGFMNICHLALDLSLQRTETLLEFSRETTSMVYIRPNPSFQLEDNPHCTCPMQVLYKFCSSKIYNQFSNMSISSNNLKIDRVRMIIHKSNRV